MVGGHGHKHIRCSISTDMSRPPHVLLTGANGMWIIGGREAKDKAGWMGCHRPYRSLAPWFYALNDLNDKIRPIVLDLVLLFSH